MKPRHSEIRDDHVFLEWCLHKHTVCHYQDHKALAEQGNIHERVGASEPKQTLSMPGR